jgi:hypothetical protein
VVVVMATEMATATVIEGGGGSGSDKKNEGMAIASGGGWRFWRLTYRGRVTPPPNLCVRLDLEKIDILEKGVSKIGKKLNFEGLNSRQILGVTPSIEKNLGRVRRPQIHRRKFWKLGCFRN